MDELKKEEIIKRIESQKGHRARILAELKIPRSTYYKWLTAYKESGLAGLAKKKTTQRIPWNRLSQKEMGRVLEIARTHPEISPRLLAVKITDEEDFSISESTVYRILKDNKLISPRAIAETSPKKEEVKPKPKRPDELWKCNVTGVFISGYGYYNMISVEDDFSHKIMANDVRPDDKAFSFSEIMDIAIKKVKKEGHLTTKNTMPDIYTDAAAPGFASVVMTDYLSSQGIKHVFSAAPRGSKKEGGADASGHQKEKHCLVVYSSPEELKKTMDEAIAIYNATPNESLDNISPNDIYAGNKDEILKSRKEKKRLTLERRKKLNIKVKKEGSDPS